MQIVQNGEVDQGLALEVEAKIRLGSEVQEIELQVHPEDGVRVGEPAGEVLSVGLDVELEDEGGAWTEVGQVNITIGNGDGNGLNQVTDGASVHVDGAGRVEDGLVG